MYDYVYLTFFESSGFNWHFAWNAMLNFKVEEKYGSKYVFYSTSNKYIYFTNVYKDNFILFLFQ